MGGDISRMFPIPGTKHVVTVRHNQIHGQLSVELDGEVAFSKMGVALTNAEAEIKLPDQRVVLIGVTFKGKLDYIYTCAFEGTNVVDTRQLSDEGDDALTISIPKAGGDPVHFSIKVDLTKNNGEKYTWITLKRYSEFDTFRKVILTAFAKSQLAENVPALPEKKFKLLQKHSDPDFVEDRRVGLEIFLRRVLLLPHIQRNPDMKAFLSPADPSQVTTVAILGIFKSKPKVGGARANVKHDDNDDL